MIGRLIIVNLLGIVLLVGLLIVGLLQDRVSLGMIVLPGTWQVMVENVLTIVQSRDPTAGLLYIRYLSNCFTTFVYALTIVSVVLGGIRLAGSKIWAVIFAAGARDVEHEPGPLADPAAMAKSLTQRQIDGVQYSNRWIQDFFGPKLAFVPPASRNAVIAACARLAAIWSTIAWTALRATALLLIVYLLYSFDDFPKTLDVLVTALRSGEMIPTLIVLIPPFAASIALSVLLVLLDIRFVRSLRPAKMPRSEVDAVADTFTTGVDYNNIVNQLPHFAQGRALPGFANTTTFVQGERASISLDNAGRFESELLIERFPEAASDPSLGAAVFRAAAGWLIYLVGLFIGLFLVLPSVTQAFLVGTTAPKEVFYLGPVLALLYYRLSARWRSTGRLMIDDGEKLARSKSFIAPIVFIRLRGTQTKGEIKIGRGRDDSVESSTQVTRSEFLAEVWASDAVTQASDVNETRDLVMLGQSALSKQWADETLDEIRELSAKRPVGIGVDIDNSDAIDLMSRNIRITGMRAQATVAGERLGAPEQFGQLSAPSSEEPISPRFCSNCGKPAPANAKFCSHCGASLP